ncbi:MAG TPA: adenylate/guanylate cyclase domain-containing protein [Terriglobales bacterium]|nr:adenylate/guanylate cyclase domain-containing protein [Terriglobales bacterium]
MSPLARLLAPLKEKAVKTFERIPARRVEVGLAVAMTLVGLGVYAFVATGTRGTIFGFLQNVEQRSLDALFKSRGPREHDPRIVIIGIDDVTLQKVGAWPIPRSGYARLIDRLKEGGAAVAAFDVSFPTPEKNSATDALNKLRAELGAAAPATVLDKIREIERSSDNDAILAGSLKRADNVILGHSFLDPEGIKRTNEKAIEEYYNILWGHPFAQMVKVDDRNQFDPRVAWQRGGGLVAQGVLPNMSLLAEASKSYGFYDVNPDSDGTVRHATLLILYKDREWYPSLPLETLRVAEDIKPQSTVGYMADSGLERIEMGPHKFFTAPDGTVLINFAGPFQTYQHYSMGDVIDGTVPASTFKDKIVIVGATAKGIGDLRSTPYQKQDQGYMGVETHANVLDNLLHNDEAARGFLRRGLNQEMIDIAFILLFGLGMGYVFGHVKPLYATLSAAGALLTFLWLVRFAFVHFGMWLFVVVPASVLIANYGSITSYRMIFEEREKRKVRRTFARYVSPGVIALIEKDPQKYFRAGGETKDLTIMFSDIRSFTTIAEGLTADELVHLLNEYLGEMTDILFRNWGTLDKYIGDAVMAFWGSPFPQDDHFVRSCRCALEMSARLEELNLKWEAEGRKQLEIGIGINTGLVNVGNMGSDKRFAWTVMGDPVNLASRLEGQNKDYHTVRIVSEFTWTRAKDHFIFRPLDRIRVKGKLKPVGIYELMAFPKDAPRYADLLAQWESAQQAYYRQAWDEAVQKFEALLSRYPDDGPSHTFLKRSHEYLKQAPDPQWDGVYVAKSK